MLSVSCVVLGLLFVATTVWGDAPYLYESQPAGSFVAAPAAGTPLRRFNRPLYGPANAGLVLAGDAPGFLQLGDDTAIHGALLLGISRAESVGFWLHHADTVPGVTVSVTYTAGQITWRVVANGTAIVASVFATAADLGFVVDINISNAQPGDELVWAFGGAYSTAGAGQATGWQFDPLLNVGVLSQEFNPAHATGNIVEIVAPGTAAAVGTAVVVCTANASSLVAASAGQWSDVSHFGLSSAHSRVNAQRIDTPPVILNLELWLDASTLNSLSDGEPVVSWANSAPSGSTGSAATPPEHATTPLYRAGLWPGQLPAVAFDGKAAALGGMVTTAAAKTVIAVFQPQDGWQADECCSGVVTLWTDPDTAGATTNGIALKSGTDGGAYLVLDFGGENDGGATALGGKAVAVAITYASTSAVACLLSNASVCEEINIDADVAHPSTNFLLGYRGSDPTPPGRHFQGLVAEVLVFSRVLAAAELAQLSAYVSAKWQLDASACTAGASPMAVGRVAVGGSVFRATITAVVAPGTVVDPVAQLAAAQVRVNDLATRIKIESPEPIINAAASALGAALDGLWRNDPPVFVHGAMAWDVPLVGWRSQYGGTVGGWPERVAAQGRYFFANQVQDSPNVECKSDPARLYTVEAPDSRFYGKGRVHPGDGMYDMQTQMFDQQVHLWRWTGNATHGALLRPALELHAEWAADCFDDDGNGLYRSYIATWPTDTVWYNGGETWETTSYLYLTHVALRDLALAAGDGPTAALHDAKALQIANATAQLWISELGMPASWREQIGHQRLRPDPWLYSVFLPIEAGLWDASQMAQALHYVEWGQQHDAVFCADNVTVCGHRVWTSNWVPSQWSVRQLWPGDEFATAQAYFTAGLPDEGFDILKGSLTQQMTQTAVPGLAGSANGGVDFNDCAHPLARVLLEGLFGYRPNYPLATVTIAPSVPTAWGADNVSVVTRDVTMWLSPGASDTSVALGASLARAVDRLEILLPIAATGIARVTLNGQAVVWTESPTFGATVVNITATGLQAGEWVVAEVTVVSFLPRVVAMTLNVTAGAQIALVPPSPMLRLVSISDPQSVLVSAVGPDPSGSFLVTVNSSIVTTHHLVLAVARGVDGALQSVQYKLVVTPAPAGPTAARVVPLKHDEFVVAANWTFAAGIAFNSNVSEIFTPNRYMSPRPATCAVRVGSDGYSGWTFTYWGGYSRPVPDFSLVPSLSIAPGIIQSAQGVQFALPAVAAAAADNIAFASQWDVFPTVQTVNVTAAEAAGASAVWVLLAGSTTPMQTRLANGVLRVLLDDGSLWQQLELVPPLNFWSLAPYGGNDYDYARDAFCLPPLPPPSVQLGADLRAMVYGFALPADGRRVASLQLEALSLEVVLGVLAVSFSRNVLIQ